MRCAPGGEGDAHGEPLPLSARCSSDPGCGAACGPRVTAAGRGVAGSWRAQGYSPGAERASGAEAQQAAALAGGAEGAAQGELPGGWRLPQAGAAEAACSAGGRISFPLHAQPSRQAELACGPGEEPGVAGVLGAAADDFDIPIEAAQGAPVIRALLYVAFAHASNRSKLACSSHPHGL